MGAHRVTAAPVPALLASLGLYAVFGTGRQLVVAGTSASAVLVFSAVTALGPKDAASYAAWRRG